MTLNIRTVLVCTFWLGRFSAEAYSTGATPGSLYDEEEARRFASLSSVTYCDDLRPVMDWTCTACTESKTPLVKGKIKVIDGGKDNATRIIVGKLRDQNGCLMAFRGSDNVENWVRDFQFWDIHPSTFDGCSGCKVHSGFYAIWQNVENLVVGALSDVGCSPTNEAVDNIIYVTGHSLGAALTHLSMFTLQKHGFHVAKTYSFEAPRIGNKAFAQQFSDRFTRLFPVFRITHSQDPVVHLPPTAFGYIHVETEVYYNKDGGYKVCPGVENASCADQFWDIPDMVAFHSGDHCNSPLVPNGDICNPSGCAKQLSPLIV